MLCTPERTISTVQFDTIEPDAIRKELHSCFPDMEVVPRVKFKMDPQFTDAVRSRLKQTTIRYTRNGIEYPERDRLPLFEAASSRPDMIEHICDVRIVAVCYKTFGALDDNDARYDGFSSARDLKRKLREFYGKIYNSEFVTIFSVEVA